MTEQQKWTSVYKTINKIEAEIIRVHLENESIPAVLINKQDSSYLSLLPGMVELHVPEALAAKAMEILQQIQQQDEQE